MKIEFSKSEILQMEQARLSPDLYDGNEPVADMNRNKYILLYGTIEDAVQAAFFVNDLSVNGKAHINDTGINFASALLSADKPDAYVIQKTMDSGDQIIKNRIEIKNILNGIGSKRTHEDKMEEALIELKNTLRTLISQIDVMMEED